MDEGINLAEGEAWAYRARGREPLVQVVVEKVGSRKPLRILVRFVDAEYEGLEEWVPPGRLKVRWAEAATLEARERRWDAVLAPTDQADEHEIEAASTVLDRLVPEGVAQMSRYDSGVLAISDVAKLADIAGASPADLDHPLSFEEDGALVVPWPVTKLVVTRAASAAPDPILLYVEQEERDARREATYGHSYGRRGANYISPEICAKVDEEHGRPVRAILRSWCGAEAADRWEELRELRTEVLRLGSLVQTAVEELRRRGGRREAERIERDLGIPVEALRSR